MAKWLIGCLLGCLAIPLMAEPSAELMQALNSRVLRVQVGLKNGQYGLGSGVVVAENQVVTNCHVVANATSISVVSGGAAYHAVGVKPDWKHDVCMLQMDDLPISPVTMKSSRDLKYEQAVFNIGYPSFVAAPVSSQGVVKGLFAMDDSVIVRATSSFRQGASGGGLFDETGALVGLITLKSPGKDAYYYYMSIDWVQALIAQPAGPIVVKSELPFWGKPAAEWPYFMKVVFPYLHKDWAGLKTIAQQWTTQEPHNTEAWFYLAAAEYETKDLTMAEQHLHRVVSMNDQHSQAFYYLGLIAESNGKHIEALANVDTLTQLDAEKAEELKVAMKTLP
ncbi:serine protease [Methylophilus sp. VKM B-3414]|jgi:serine protease Do|uniref:S1 family peptidase n=1 Tax=Methylophilus sp. VKM B-3414 TaxID=3076121 RepID=UPI0028C6E60F|nr:serine protease [Methylophilus sp. VKM B-3414]MDT7848853.1 serine protease [Methylophilus sp. VKM B-3414]